MYRKAQCMCELRDGSLPLPLAGYRDKPDQDGCCWTVLLCSSCDSSPPHPSSPCLICVEIMFTSNCFQVTEMKQMLLTPRSASHRYGNLTVNVSWCLCALLIIKFVPSHRLRRNQKGKEERPSGYFDWKVDFSRDWWLISLLNWVAL